MTATQWYELRVQGSIGTREGNARGATEGVAISDDGHICSVACGCAMRFESEQAAMDYLSKCTIPGKNHFEIVACQRQPITA